MNSRDPIPSANDIRALADFWQTHSATDYEDLMEEVPGPVFVRKPRTSTTTTPTASLDESDGTNTPIIV